jgi:gamma-glutamylcyclotransferase (GGCT)/AIG2-like uncharacterized protein YtfP
MPSFTPEHLFVYGTLRRGAQHEMRQVVARGARFVGHGVVRARLFDLGDYPGMALSDFDEDRVVGDVYRLLPARAGATLDVLDDYEGLGRNDPVPRLYCRNVVRVQLRDGPAVRAWAYVLAMPDPPYPRITEGEYLQWKQKRARGTRV